MDIRKKIHLNGLTASIFCIVVALGSVASNYLVAHVNAGMGPGGDNRNTKSYPVVNLRSVENRYSWGGVMNFPNTQNVAVYLESYEVSGDANITLYKASEQNLLNYLIHDATNNQKDTNISVADFPVVAKLTQNVRSGYDNRVLISLPITEEAGIWYFTVTLNSTSNHGFIVKSSFGLSAVESKDSYIFWAQDFKSHKSVNDVEVSVYSLLDSRKELSVGKTNDKGILETSFNALADVALAKRGNDYALLPLNLTYLNTNFESYSRFDGKYAKGKYFIFTDRPIYKPGDTVYYKVIVRDTEGAGYLIPQGPITVRLGQVENPLFEKTLTLSDLGTADGEYTLPTNTETGYQNLVVSLPKSASRPPYDEQYAYFQVENYRKPEYFLDVTTSVRDAKVGETVPIALTGTFFSGHPASGLDISYTVTMSDWSDYEWGTSFEESASYYGSYYGEEVQKSTVQLDHTGTYLLNIDTKKFAPKAKKNKIISVNATLIDSSGNPSTRTSNFLLYSADYTAYPAPDITYSTPAGSDGYMAYMLKANKPDTKEQDLTAKYSVERITWEKSGIKDSWGYDSYQEKKYSIVKNVQDTVSPAEFEKYTVKFPALQGGSYHITISFTDSSGGVYSREDWIWVHSPGEAWYGYDGEAISVTSKKQSYAPDDTTSLTVNVPYLSGDAFVALGKSNVLTYDVLTVSEGIATYSPPVKDIYLPQVAVFAYGFSGKRLLSGNATLTFDTKNKKIVVGIKPEKSTYGPGETATVEITTKDVNGNGVPAEVTVWAMDKALTELVAGSKDDIFKTFWGVNQSNYYWGGLWLQSASSLENINFYDEGGGGGGCFGTDTQITMSDGSTKPIHKVVVGDAIRTLTNGKTGASVIAKVTGIHQTEAYGYLLINGDMQITPNHILSVNNRWRMAGDIQVGDELTREGGVTEKVTTVQYIDEQIPVYNLTIEGYHTFIADGVWVHNQKGDAARGVFKDTAYWNPNLQTNSQGTATIYVKLPDNLTTWILQGVAVGDSTKVGSIAKEIIVTKNIIMRPIIANQYRVGDAYRLEASIENYTDSKQTFDYSLVAPELTISKPTGVVTIDAKGKVMVAWDARAKSANKDAKFTFSAKSQSIATDSDSIIMTVPVSDIYLQDDVSAFATGNHTFSVDIPRGVDMTQSTLKLSLASSISHTLPSSLEYLISYPYGCTEQTTTRLMALLMAKENPALFKEVIKDKDVEDMIEKGIPRIVKLQRLDGGWGYWTNGNSEPFTSLYVTILLKRLMLAGYTVPEYTYNYAKTYVNKNTQFIDTKNPDMLALMLVYRMVVLEESPDTVAINSLKKQALVLGESAHWSAGLWKRYGSIDSSTGLVLQALSIAGDTDLALRTKAVRYLMANRKHAYWSHTFGTLQSAYGILLSEKENPEGVTLPYSVKVGDMEITSGTLKIPEEKVIMLPLKPNMFTSAMPVSIQYSGKIQGYATLTAHWVHTNPAIEARSSGLTVTRRYENATDKEQSIGVGDLVKVIIDVRGDTAFDTQYVVVEDQLPSGMIPVNTRLKNEYDNQANGSQYRYGDSYEYGLAGVVIGSSDWYGNRLKDTFTYQARVVSGGSFHAPPVRAQLMYLPEVSGHSASNAIVIQQKGTLPLPVLVKRTSAKAVKGIIDWMYQLYEKATSPIERVFTREYINDFAVIIFFAIGAGVVVKGVASLVLKFKHKRMNKFKNKNLTESGEESSPKH